MTDSAFATFCKYWIWAGIPVMLIGLVVLGLLIAGVVAMIKRAHLFKVPVAAEQKIQFTEPGQVILSIEGPRFSSRFAQINFELTGVNGDSVEGHRVVFRARTSGLSTARVELLKYDIPRAGSCVLRMTGSGVTREGDVTDAVVFMRPHLGKSVVYVIGIVLTSGVFIGSLVFFLLSLTAAQPGAPASS